jgi:hypothetical protein
MALMPVCKGSRTGCRATMPGAFNSMPVGTPDFVTFFDRVRFAKYRSAHVVLLEVEHETVDAVGELEQLTGRRLVQSVDAGNTVTGREHAASFPHLDFAAVFTDLAFDDVADFGRANIHL